MNATDLKQMLDAYKAAVYAKDVAAFMALYDEEVRVFDMWGKWSYDGAQAWRGMVADWFGSLGTGRVVVAFDDVQINMTEDLGVAQAFVTYKGVSAGGEELRAMQNRLTCVFRQKGGVWKIIHEHSSTPVDFETAKAVLRR